MTKFYVSVSKPSGEFVERQFFKVLGQAQDFYRSMSDKGFFCMIHMIED